MIAGQHWDTAARVAGTVVAAVLTAPAGDPFVVNVNVPNVPFEELAGWRHTAVALLPTRTVATGRLHPIAGRDGVYSVEMEWGDAIELPPDTDTGAVEQGVVAVSYLSRLEHEDRADLAAVAEGLDGLLGAARTLRP